MGNKKKPLLHHGAKPMSRRDAIARGFMMGGSIAVVPSVFTEILAQKAFGAECAAVDAAANDRIPLITFHFQGGINFLNTGLGMRGDGAGGNADAMAMRHLRYTNESVAKVLLLDFTKQTEEQRFIMNLSFVKSSSSNFATNSFV